MILLQHHLFTVPNESIDTSKNWICHVDWSTSVFVLISYFRFLRNVSLFLLVFFVLCFSFCLSLFLLLSFFVSSFVFLCFFFCLSLFLLLFYFVSSFVLLCFSFCLSMFLLLSFYVCTFVFLCFFFCLSMFLLLSFYVSSFVFLCFRKISRIITRKLFQLSEQKLLNLIIIKHGKKNLRKRKLVEVELSLSDIVLSSSKHFCRMIISLFFILINDKTCIVL
jgi:hypothetical protein